MGRGVYSTYLVVSILYIPYCYSFPFCFRLFVTNFRCLLFGFLFLFSFFKFCIFVVWWPAFLPKVNMITVWVSFFLIMKEKNLKYVNASTKRSFGILLQVDNIPALMKTESCWNTLRHISRTIFNSFLAAAFFGSIFWRDNKSLAAESYCPNACQIPTEQQLSWLQTVTNTIVGWKKYSALNMWYAVTNTLKSIQLEARWATSSNYCIRFELGRVVWLFVQE